MEPQLEGLRDFAARYTAAWSSGNAQSVAECFCETGSLRINSDPVAVGREAIAAVAQAYMTAFPDLRLVMDNLLLRSDGAEYHWTLTGTFFGPDGVQRKVCFSGFEKWNLGEDGLIATSLGQFDAAEFQRQLGG